MRNRCISKEKPLYSPASTLPTNNALLEDGSFTWLYLFMDIFTPGCDILEQKPNRKTKFCATAHYLGRKFPHMIPRKSETYI